MVCWDKNQIERTIRDIEDFKSKTQGGLRQAEEEEEVGIAAVFEEVIDELDENAQYLRNRIKLMEIRKEKIACFEWPRKEKLRPIFPKK